VPTIKEVSMKITREDFKRLSYVIIDTLEGLPNIKDKYKLAGLTKERFAWDILWESKFDVSPLYDYLNDSHIQTALFKIVGEY